MNGKMYLGLDMGTNSVGWAVTNEKYELQRAKGKDLWGSRLFDDAQTSAERRSYRISRRRRERELARIGFLMDVFSDEITKVDAGFYLRLKESKYHFEDRSDDNRQKYALFNDEKFTDADYFKTYPTIFHLRKDLLVSDAPHDVRLVFLALLNMFKHRGNFLSESIDSDGEAGNIIDAYKAFIDETTLFNISFDESFDATELEQILSQKGVSKSIIAEKLCSAMNISKKDKAQYALVSLLSGKTAKLIDIYGDTVIDEENKGFSICFRDSNYEQKEIEARALLGDEFYSVIEATKEIHDIGLFANIMKGQPYLTFARVETYNDHQNDLKLLKKVLLKYDHSAYENMFRSMEADNYSAYVGSVYSHGKRQRRGLGKKASRDDLYKNIKKVISKFPQDDEDVIEILKKIEGESFLPKQLTSDNGVIPNQEYVREMKKILSNAENYLPFLKEKDDSGLALSERLIQLFSFHMPYYVGPIGQEHLDEKGYNVWARRIAPGKVYPWNLNEKIDTKEAAEKFIERMVRKCSYLTNENTLPKNSLLYEKFTVLNELNNLKVKGESISVETKQDIFNTLFKKGKKVSVKALEKYFKSNGQVAPEETDFLSGIDTEGGFKASLSSLGKFQGIFGEDANKESYQTMIENIIFWATIYGNDKAFLRERISEKYEDKIGPNQLKRICGFKFDGWGNLSREFLQLEGSSNKDAQSRSIIGALWETNDNLMQLLSGEYTYQEAIANTIGKVEKSLSEWTIDDLDGMYLSAPVKRMVWQTLKIMKELEEVTGEKPERIFVEMPRENGIKGERKASRKKKLYDLYSSLKSEEKAWRDDIDGRPEADFRIKKLYLYYLQMGKCMYTGEPIDLEKLLKSNEDYDIDHIYPRHFIKDDSIENNLVLVKKQNNSRKSDNYPVDADIQKKMFSFWKVLSDKGFITKEKYHRLIRVTEFSDEERAAFVSRQIVETRQGTKAITQILKQAYPDATIVFSKAGEVSDFRKQFDLIKVRCVNDFHHAQDAYLNVVVGNTYYCKFTGNPLNFVREAAKHSFMGDYAYHMDQIFLHDVKSGNEIVWKASKDDTSGSIVTVKHIMDKNSSLITKRSYVAHGGINGKETIYSKTVAKEGAYLPVDGSNPKLADVTKYGGRTSIANMCYALVSYQAKGETVLSLEALPIYLGDIETIPDEKILEYLNKALKLENKNKPVTNLQIKKRYIRYGSKIKLDGAYYYLAGKTGNQIYLENAVPLILAKGDKEYIKKIENAIGTGDFESTDKQGNNLFTSSRNIALLNTLKLKLESSAYKNKKTSLLTLLEENQEEFEKLNVGEQCYVIFQIISWLQLVCIGADMRLINGSQNSGKCLMSKKITDAKEAKLIQESVTGLYIKEIDLLAL